MANTHRQKSTLNHGFCARGRKHCHYPYTPDIWRSGHCALPASYRQTGWLTAVINDYWALFRVNPVTHQRSITRPAFRASLVPGSNSCSSGYNQRQIIKTRHRKDGLKPSVSKVLIV